MLVGNCMYGVCGGTGMCLIPHRWELWNAEVLQRAGVFWRTFRKRSYFIYMSVMQAPWATFCT